MREGRVFRLQWRHRCHDKDSTYRTIEASDDVPALQPGPRRGRPSELLRSIVQLSASDAIDVRIDDDTFRGASVQELRAQILYLRLGVRRTRDGCVRDWVERVLGSRANADFWRILDLLLDDEVDFDCLAATPWTQLTDFEAEAIDVALCLVRAPRAILLDGRASSGEMEVRILSVGRKLGIPIVWDGCAARTMQCTKCTPFSCEAPEQLNDVEGRAVVDRESIGTTAGTVSNFSSGLIQWTVLAFALVCGVEGTTRVNVGVADASARVVQFVRSVVSSNGAVYIPWWRIATLTAVVSCVLILSVVLELGIATQLCIASARCFVQLSMLGFILVPIIRGNNPLIVLSYITLMILIAGLEASGRPPWVYPGIFWVCFGSVLVSVGTLGAFVFNVVIGTGLEAQYAIPILGMLMGSALSGVSVGVSATVRNIVEKSDTIEALLALGATRWEATREVVRTSVVLGLTNLLNSLSVVGLVSIPGMMTGQIIGGTPPGLAARYQMVIMYSVCGSTCASVVLSVFGTVLCVTDRCHRVRLELLVERKKSKKFFEVAFEGLANMIRPRQQFVSIPEQHLRSTGDADYGSVREANPRSSTLASKN